MMGDVLNASEPLSRTCTLDPQVLALHQADQAANHTKYFIALNLKQSQALMPHIVRQILTLVVNMEPGSTYVSVYESGEGLDTAGSRQIIADAVLCTSTG